MKEVWKDVVDYEGLYQVSNYGNVRSLNWHNTGKARLLKPRVLKWSHDLCARLQVTLYKDGKAKSYLVHRLVAMAFIPNPNHLPEVNHKSECPVLNFACVLEWCDRKYNCNYGTKVQRQIEAVSKPIDQFDTIGRFIKRWKSGIEASRQLGISEGSIADCARKERRKTAGGFVWKYVES